MGTGFDFNLCPYTENFQSVSGDRLASVMKESRYFHEQIHEQIADDCNLGHDLGHEQSCLLYEDKAKNLGHDVLMPES